MRLPSPDSRRRVDDIRCTTLAEWLAPGHPSADIDARSTRPTVWPRGPLTSIKEAALSVIVILRIPGNPADLERYAAGPGGDIMKRISSAGHAAGATRHRFAAGDNEVLVVDEWPDAASFEAFFAGQPE